jgi:hypothetical protein
MGRIFKDAMTTAAAIDRLVHHAVILEMTGPSVRAEEAKKGGRTSTDARPLPATTTTNGCSQGRVSMGRCNC